MIRKYTGIFCWKNVSSFCSAKATHIFSAKNIRILCIESAKTVNEMTLNDVVKLTTLWTTGPRQLKTAIYAIVCLSLLTMTNPNQLCDVLLFVCSKMSDETNLSSKLPVADRTREVWERKLCWWCLSSGFLLCTFLLGFPDSFCFVFTSSPSYEASPLCSILCILFPRLCWYVEVLKGGFEGVFVSLLLTTMGAFYDL